MLMILVAFAMALAMMIATMVTLMNEAQSKSHFAGEPVMLGEHYQAAKGRAS
ncbi:MAG: hypothetical protein AAF468_09120 [Pseudomonadota bacterium]